MATRNRTEKRIFFPWEHRGGWLRRLGLDRMRPFLGVAVVLGLMVLVGLRERRQSGVRRTRALIESYRAAVDAYRADNDWKCPRSLDALKDYLDIKSEARDAWGNPLRFVCPWSKDGVPYLLASDGADGQPAGLDRIE